MQYIATFAALAAFAGAAFAQSSGTRVDTLPTRQPTVTSEGVEVAEVFMYHCPHCYSTEPHLASWLERKADYVNFVRIPAPWDPVSEIHARAYYAAELLGKLEQIHPAFYEEFHRQGNLLDTEAKLAEFFGRFDVAESDFKQVLNSFAVQTKVRRAAELIRLYGIRGTPGIIVAGQYKPDLGSAGSYEAWFAKVDELAATEHAAKQAAE